jgi:hypothetical protein
MAKMPLISESTMIMAISRPKAFVWVMRLCKPFQDCPSYHQQHDFVTGQTPLALAPTVKKICILP